MIYRAVAYKIFLYHFPICSIKKIQIWCLLIECVGICLLFTHLFFFLVVILSPILNTWDNSKYYIFLYLACFLKPILDKSVFLPSKAVILGTIINLLSCLIWSVSFWLNIYWGTWLNRRAIWQGMLDLGRLTLPQICSWCHNIWYLISIYSNYGNFFMYPSKENQTQWPLSYLIII